MTTLRLLTIYAVSWKKNSLPFWLYVVLGWADTEIFFFPRKNICLLLVIVDDLPLKEK